MHATSTINVRLALEAEADRLQDAAAATLERWRDLQTQVAACERALRQLPESLSFIGRAA